MSYRPHDKDLPPEVHELEEALDAMMDRIEQGKDEAEKEDVWPGFVNRLFKRVEEEGYLAAHILDALKRVIWHLVRLIDELTEQRDAALMANKEMIALLEKLETEDQKTILWMISALQNDKGDDRSYRLRRVLIHLARLKRKFERRW